MHLKGGSENVRVSISSTHSASSQGSLHGDSDTFGDVYIWGEVICDGSSPEGTNNQLCGSTDVLLPRPLVSRILLDVHQVACGSRHAALINKQGEVFTWGEEAGGRLGHGVGTDDIAQPCLVESLTTSHIDHVACGEFHTCAVTSAGELYAWGDGVHNIGLLGHGTTVSHWIPKRVSGPLEGLQVAYVSCGTWHTALITSTGQLFTFGDGTFGALGHGDRQTITYPKEVESLMGLKTIAVACGVWHTAALVEVITTKSSVGISSGKLFTWGDGDKYRLGHGDREPRLKPTCVSSVMDYNFNKIACGHSLTVCLTKSGRVFTMGSAVHGQLGHPDSDGRSPCLVEDKLSSESVEEVACGSYHVAVLTAKHEVYTWGKGANGRLGHGDTEDRNTPSRVEALEDRLVHSIACGSSFTAAICYHKWVSGASHIHCSSCKHTFGFTRKRHHCYNCGLVYCHSCSSRKASRAALSPNPAKPHRVCDSCYMILDKVVDPLALRKKTGLAHFTGEDGEIDVCNNMNMINSLDAKADKHGKKSEQFSLLWHRQVSTLLHLKDILIHHIPHSHHSDLANGDTPSVHSKTSLSDLTSFEIPSTPPPTLTTRALELSPRKESRDLVDNLKEANELLNIEVEKLHIEIQHLKQCCEKQRSDLQKAESKAKEAMALAAEEVAKSKAAKDVMKCLTGQLKLMAENLPATAFGNGDRLEHLANGVEPSAAKVADLSEDSQTVKNSGNSLHIHATTNLPKANGTHCQIPACNDNQVCPSYANPKAACVGNDGNAYLAHQNRNATTIWSPAKTNFDEDQEYNEYGYADKGKPKSYVSVGTGNTEVEAEWIEQFEPGVYISLVALRDGSRDLKRVRFSRRRFGEHQAATWWSENRLKVYEKFNIHTSHKAPSMPSPQSAHRSGEFWWSPQTIPLAPQLCSS